MLDIINWKLKKRKQPTSFFFTKTAFKSWENPHRPFSSCWVLWHFFIIWCCQRRWRRHWYHLGKHPMFLIAYSYVCENILRKSSWFQTGHIRRSKAWEEIGYFDFLLLWSSLGLLWNIYWHLLCLGDKAGCGFWDAWLHWHELSGKLVCVYQPRKFPIKWGWEGTRWVSFWCRNQLSATCVYGLYL